MERLAGLNDGKTMLCVAGDFNAHIGMFEPVDEESMNIWMGNKEQERTRTGGNVEEERVGGRGHVLPEEGDTKAHTGADGTRQSSVV